MSQSKTEFGLTAEGSWFMPGEYANYAQPNKDAFGAGIGVYASKSIFNKLSMDAGVTFRYKKMKEYYNISPVTNGNYGGYGGGYGNYGGYGYSYEYSPETIQGWKSFPLNYIVLPVHLNYNLNKNIFVRGGVEASWLTNHYTGNDKTEFNWTLGLGTHFDRLNVSVNYIRGFKEVAFANNLFTVDGMRSATVYRNNMIQLSLSYLLWQKK